MVRCAGSGPAFPVRNADGKVYRVAGIGEDITEQKQVEEKLQENSEFTRQVVNSVQEGLVVLDADFRYSLWNTFMENLSGKPASEVLGKRPWEVFPFLSEATSRPLVESALSGVTTIVPDMFTDPPPPGRSAWVSQVLMPMRDAAGRVVGVLCTLNDITARKKAEEARNRLAAIVESAADAIIGKNLDGTIISWNAGAERLFGYAAAETIGRNIAPIIPAERQEEKRQFRARIVRGESIENYETVRLHKSGRRVDVALSISPVRDAAGSVIGCAKIMHDVTTRKRLENEVLEIANREQRRIGQVLHDTTGQELTALWLLAEALVKTLKRDEEEGMRDEEEGMRDEGRGMKDEVLGLPSSLIPHPSSLHTGLPSSLIPHPSSLHTGLPSSLIPHPSSLIPSHGSSFIPHLSSLIPSHVPSFDRRQTCSGAAKYARPGPGHCPRPGSGGSGLSGTGRGPGRTCRPHQRLDWA